MKIAVEGCAHGELDKIYEAIQHLEKQNSIKVDLLIICGDFQAVRNPVDLQCMAVPPKYRKLNTFYKYYSGVKKAPILTIFVGGNHEASNYLSELPYGGWVCPNIYYLGYANVINIGGIRIAGISGIYKGHDYLKGHFECPPYNESSRKSVYHVRNVDVFRLKQIKKPIDIFISHDWPTGVYNFGDKKDLLKRKPFFRDEVSNNSLGSPPSEELLKILKPSYWFAAHMHCKFAAVIPHSENESKTFTRFLALDKCLPRRKFLQVIDIENSDPSRDICYDPEWLCVLHSTNHLLTLTKRNNFMPGKGCSERWEFSPSDEEVETIREMFNNDLKVPENFSVTAPCYDPLKNNLQDTKLKSYVNPQTENFCKILNLTNPLTEITHSVVEDSINKSFFDHNEIKISDDSDDEPESTNPDIDTSGFGEFFIDKVGSHPVKGNSERSTENYSFPEIKEDNLKTDNADGNSERSAENYSFPEIKEDDLKTDSTEVNAENPLKKFKRRNFDLYKSEDTDL